MPDEDGVVARLGQLAGNDPLGRAPRFDVQIGRFVHDPDRAEAGRPVRLPQSRLHAPASVNLDYPDLRDLVRRQVAPPADTRVLPQEDIELVAARRKRPDAEGSILLRIDPAQAGHDDVRSYGRSSSRIDDLTGDERRRPGARTDDQSQLPASRHHPLLLRDARLRATEP